MNTKCFDNGGRSFDRYTVIFPAERNHRGERFYPYVGMSEHPTHPQGFGQHGELKPPGRAGFKFLGKRIKFDDLPPDCRALVTRELDQ